MTARVHVTLDEDVRAFGEPLRGKIRVEVARSIAVRSVGVAAYVERAEWPFLVRSVPGRAQELHGPGVLEPGERVWPFELLAPAGPPSYSGRTFEVAWLVGDFLELEGEAPVLGTAPFRLLSRPGFAVASSPTPRPDLDPEPWIVRKGCDGLLVALGLSSICCLAGIVLFSGSWLAKSSMRLMTDPTSLDPQDFFIAALFGTVGAVVLGTGAWRVFGRRLLSLWARRRIGEPAVDVSPREAGSGDFLTIRVRFRPRREVDLDARAALTALERTKEDFPETREVCRVEVPLEGPREVRPGDEVLLEGRLAVPPSAPPTYEDGLRALRWSVTATIDVAGWPGWSETIPVTVVPPGCFARP